MTAWVRDKGLSKGLLKEEFHEKVTIDLRMGAIGETEGEGSFSG